MNKKIGILTYHDSDNFGSVLQAYALSRYLNLSGFDCEIVDYRKSEVEKLYRIFKPLTCRYNILTDIYFLPYYHALKKRKEHFESFRQKMLPLSKKSYSEPTQLRDCDYDQYIVGSDQVWNMDIVDFDTSYMLDFTDMKKTSYAASFGPRRKSAEQLNEYQKYLKKFSRISVREKLAQDMCIKDLGIPAEIVCDPVFLLGQSEWKMAASEYPDRPERYILCYFPGGVSREMELFSQKIADEQGRKRVLLMPEWRNSIRSGIKAYDCGPGEFLDLILHADSICTSSFHGAAFSLLFEKNFFVSLNGGDERIRTVLQYVPEKEKTYLGEISKVSKRIIEHSKRFLKETLAIE